MINKSNYEIYLIDYLDGNLSPDQVADLLLFLETHPEIAEEFEGIADVKIPTASGSFSEKQSLKKQELPLSANDIDLLLAKKLEGDLTPEESVLVEELLTAYPEVLTAWKLMQLTIVPEEEVVFVDKGALIVLTEESADSDQEMLIAELEGDLSSEEKVLLESKLEESEGLRKDRILFSKTILEADASLIFPGKRKLKKTPVVRLYASFATAVAAAAAIALFFVLDFGGDSVGNSIASHRVQIGNKDVPTTFVSEDESSNDVDVEEAHEVMIPETTPQQDQVTYEMAFAQLPQKSAPGSISSSNSVPVILTSNRKVVPYQLEEEIADIPNGGEFPTVKEFLGKKVKKGLWGGSDYPEDDYTMALLGKAADKYNDRSGSDVEIGSEKKEDDKFFVKIGKFSISR